MDEDNTEELEKEVLEQLKNEEPVKGIDLNNNGVLDDDELTDEQLAEKKRAHFHQKDLRLVYYLIYAFTLIVLTAKFISFNVYNVLMDIDISKLAYAMSIFIIFVGVSEGIRSFSKTATETENAPVPAYKLKILLGYLISFGIITIIAVIFEFYTKFKYKDYANMILPSFSINDFIEGILTNTVSYVIARFGNKVAEKIDLSNVKFFKK